MTKCIQCRRLVKLIWELVEDKKCALTTLFHFRARPLAQLADRNSKIWTPKPTRRCTAYICRSFGISNAGWSFFGWNGEDFLNYSMSQVVKTWSELKNPGVIVPLGISDRTIHAWLRTLTVATQRPILLLVPPFKNSCWARELLSHLTRVTAPLYLDLYWTAETRRTRNKCRCYWAYLWRPRTR